MRVSDTEVKSEHEVTLGKDVETVGRKPLISSQLGSQMCRMMKPLETI